MVTAAAKRKKSVFGKISVSKVIIGLILLIVAAVTLYPVVYIISMSLSDVKHIIAQDVYLWPKDFSVYSYKLLFREPDIWIAYKNTIIYTVGGTAVGLICIVPLSYAVSQKAFHYRRVVIWFVMITMFFSGGIIPLYMLVNSLRMMNTMWAIILPGAVSAWYMIITRTYFTTISPSLFESASIDGASELRKCFFIAIPLAKPIIAVLALYMVVGYWNTYFSALLFLDEISKHPLQNYLQKILFTDSAGGNFDPSGPASGAIQVEQIKYSAIVMAMFPIMVIYPFLQRFFVQGIMIGSIKE